MLSHVGDKRRRSVRNQSNTCPATVTQSSDIDFRRGRHQHSHPAVLGVDIAKPIVHDIKVAARQDVYQPALDIVDKTLKNAGLSQPCPALPSVGNIIRCTNRHRSAARPKDPEDLAFSLDMSHIPDDFLQADLTEDGQCHLLFASPECLQLLFVSKSWYIDGNFSVVGKPFKQFLSVHCFVKCENCVFALRPSVTHYAAFSIT